MSTSPNEHSATAIAPVLDTARLALLMEMGGEDESAMIKDIVMQFLVDITGVMSRVDTAICTGNFSQIVSIAHTIKGSAATFGLCQVERIALELDTAARDNAKHDTIPAIYQSLRAAFDTGREALEAYFAER